jgi:2-methylcitrate dehydratase PrpD
MKPSGRGGCELATTYHEDRIMLSMTRRLVRAASAVSYGSLEHAVVHKAKICLLDFLSCAFEARDHPWSRQAVSLARSVSEGATIVGYDNVAAPGEAAFANATLGHGLVREDMHAGSICHHGVVVWPVLLGLAERTRVSGADLLCAAVLGYEAGSRIGRALFTADLARLFRPTGVVGPLGAAVAGSRLLKLSEDSAVSAVAIAANTSSGLNQWPHTGGSEMYFHPGFVARNAIAAVELAEAGAYASETILEGEAGIFAAFKRERIHTPIELFAGAHSEILEVYNKPVPACNFAQTACQAAVQLPSAGKNVRDIKSISVLLPEAAIRYPGCDFAGPFERALQAKMSIQFGVAAALVRGVIEEANYANLSHPEIRRLAELIVLERDDGFTAAFPARQGAEVRVRLADGTLVVRRIDDVIAATEAEIRARFLTAAAEVVGASRADQIQDLVERCEKIADAATIVALCRTDSSREANREQRRHVPGRLTA